MEGLNILVEKLSHYNFVTNIVPGTVLCIILKYLIGYDLFVTDNWYLMGIVFYFVGMICNRFGSLVIEPLLKKRAKKYFKFAPYKNYVEAEKKDHKIEILNRESNVFRSCISLCILSLVALLFQFLSCCYGWLNEWKSVIFIALVLLLFLFSYQKQITYVRRRVEVYFPEKNENEKEGK